MALSDFRVRYIRDEVKDRQQPICYDISDKQFTQNPDYLKAIAKATVEQRAEYVERAREIEHIHKEFNRLKSSGLDYDCFICVKVSDDERTDASGKKMRTSDCMYADELYFALKGKGYKPFFSERDLAGATGADYEAHILYALYSSESMLVVCGDERYLQTKWVKNEYLRYMKLTRDAGRDDDNLTIVFKGGVPIERLPGRQGKVQGINGDAIDALERVVDFVGANLSANMRPLDIERKEYSAKSYERKNVERSGVTKRDIKIAAATAVSGNEQTRLRLAEDFMNRHDYKGARNWCDGIINEFPLCGRAYWLRFLAQHGCANDLDFIVSAATITDFEYLEKAISATGDHTARMAYYTALEQRVRRRRDLYAYREYIVLPESDDDIIAELTDFMYDHARSKKDTEVFDAIINTVRDTDRYIQMNLAFARQLPADAASKYYRNVLEADNGHKEALYYCFEAEHADVFAFCGDAGNQQKVIDALYSYGYNEYATQKLYDMVVENIPTRVQQALSLFDFLITVIPKSKDKKLLEYLHAVIDKLYDTRCGKYAKKYVEYCLTLDAHDDIAFFYRVLVNHNFVNPLEIMSLGDELIGDTDFYSAINCYTERNADGNNFYLDVNSELGKLRATLGDMTGAAVRSVYIPRASLDKCDREVRRGMTARAHELVDGFLARYKCEKLDDTFRLKKEVGGDAELNEAYNFARVGTNTEFASEILRVINGQGAVVKNYKKRAFKDGVIHVLVSLPTVIAIAFALVALYDPMIVFGVFAERFLSLGIPMTIGGVIFIIIGGVMNHNVCDEVNCNIMLRGGITYTALMIFVMVRTAMML